MSDARNVQLLRILGMIRDLSAARTGVTIQDLRERYSVTRRTIERDLGAIESAGYTVETLNDDEPGKVRKRILAGSGGFNLPITAEELACAHAGVAALERDAPASVAATLRMLVNRLEESQAIRVGVDAEGLVDAQAFVLRPGSVPTIDAAALDVIKTAILKSKQLRVTYSKGGTEPVRVYLAEPYGLLYGAKGYLVWRGVKDGKWRKFALPHIESVEQTDETFVRDPDFDLEEFAADAFGVCWEKPIEIVLRVLPEGIARLRHHKFHPSQTVENSEDGTAIVRFTAGGLTEICWHLFSWGAAVEIQAPDELVAAYASQIEQARQTLPTGSHKCQCSR